jgi:predicted RNA polymerase sigma factor
MSEPRALVEHFFRLEFGRLSAALTRSLGVRHLALVEDVVQAAHVRALETWSRRGACPTPFFDLTFDEYDDLVDREAERRDRFSMSAIASRIGSRNG